MAPKPSIQVEWLLIPADELEFSYSRSSGPGGQNVNKVNSKATLRWCGLRSPSLPIGVRQRLIENYGSRITTDGDFLISSDRNRDQARNADDCLEKLKAILTEVLHPPKPRKPTKPTKGSKRRRLEDKSRNSEKKRLRK